MTQRVEAAVAGLVLRYGVTAAQCDSLAALLDAIAADEHAPTAVREPERAADVHLADSLVALEVGRLRATVRIADLGTGAGFPGLPLAIAMPGSAVALVESQARKCRFIWRLIAAAGVDNAHVVEARVESWRGGLGAHDAVLARALAPQPVVLEYAAPLLAHGGMLVDWRGRRDFDEEATALRAASELGMELLEIRSVQPFASARDRNLHLYLKVGETPPRFPRRPGVARKRPLGRRPSSANRDRPHNGAASTEPTGVGGSVR